jgi:hypothetical protein
MQRVMNARCPRRTGALLIARQPLASGSYAHKDRYQGLPRASAAREYHRRSTVYRGFLVSNMHLENCVSTFNAAALKEKEKLGRTEMPLLHSVWCLHVDRVRLLDHMLASSPGPHSRCANGILLVPAQQSHNMSKVLFAINTTEKDMPYRPSPLDHQGFRCCVLLVVEEKVLLQASVARRRGDRRS